MQEVSQIAHEQWSGIQSHTTDKTPRAEEDGCRPRSKPKRGAPTSKRQRTLARRMFTMITAVVYWRAGSVDKVDVALKALKSSSTREASHDREVTRSTTINGVAMT